MTPKEKAIELVNKFKSLEIEVAARYQGYGESCNYIEMQTFDAKQCALIAVDECFNAMSKFADINNIAHHAKFMYYEEVKQEIEKL